MVGHGHDGVGHGRDGAGHGHMLGGAPEHSIHTKEGKTYIKMAHNCLNCL